MYIKIESIHNGETCASYCMSEFKEKYLKALSNNFHTIINIKEIPQIDIIISNEPEKIKPLPQSYIYSGIFFKK
jgi:hypothetical protein